MLVTKCIKFDHHLILHINKIYGSTDSFQSNFYNNCDDCFFCFVSHHQIIQYIPLNYIINNPSKNCNCCSFGIVGYFWSICMYIQLAYKIKPFYAKCSSLLDQIVVSAKSFLSFVLLDIHNLLSLWVTSCDFPLVATLSWLYRRIPRSIMILLVYFCTNE